MAAPCVGRRWHGIRVQASDRGPILLPPERQSHGESGSLSEVVFNRYGAPQHFAKFFSDGQAQSRSAVLASRRGIRLGKRFENLGELSLRHADSGVLYLELDLIFLPPRDS